MNYYPICINLEGKKVLIVGGGYLGSRKVKELINCGADVTIISPDLHEDIDKNQITWVRRKFDQDDVSPYVLVIAATNDHEVHETIFEICDKAGKLVNIVDDVSHCNYIMPAVIRRGDLLVTVCSSGSAPFFTKALAAELREEYGDEMATYIDLLKGARVVVMEKCESMDEKNKYYDQLLNPFILELVRQGQVDQAKEKIEEIVKS